MDRRSFIGGLIAMPAIIKVAGVMRVKPFHRYTFTDIDLTFDNGGNGAISLNGFEMTPPILLTRDPYIAGLVWNDNGMLRVSEG